ncbi:MAG: hypothetical protein WCD38_11580 [Candidatus Tumulicola sp.]
MPKADKLAKALVRGVEHALLHDYGYTSPKIKTGQVVLAPTRRKTLAAAIAKHLAPERFVAYGAEQAPASRVREVNDYIEERWLAVPAPVRSMADVANGVVPIAGWTVTQHVRYAPQPLNDMAPDELREKLCSISVQTNDDATYAGHYPTIPGRDVAHYDDSKQGMAAYQGGAVLRGEATATSDGIIRGGREIRGGRTEWRKAMKETNCEIWDKGWFKHADRIKAEKAYERKKKHDVRVEMKVKKLPMKAEL